MAVVQIRRLFPIAASICILAGCVNSMVPGAPVPQFANWPEGVNGMRIRWTAEPGVDLLTGPVVPVRAYFESWFIGFLTRTAGDKLYPGFDSAVPDAELRPEHSFTTKDGPFFGTEALHVIEVALRPREVGQRTGDSSDVYMVYLCESRFNVFHPSPHQPGKYESLDAQTLVGTLMPWRIMVKPPNAGVSKLPPQSGPLPAPRGDVFGGWTITDVNADWANMSETDRDDYNQHDQQCKRTSSTTSDERIKISSTLLDSPPAPQSAVPGWPDADSAKL
ncbi:polymorphic toxin immunity protein [Mycobacterium phage Aegeus]|nr:polymorphic toxin immunity protein [Mycobacterium phage Baudelaire]WKW86526.1 polymorphic toxin immunity protein [Mycobacterium phage Aegeus]